MASHSIIAESRSENRLRGLRIPLVNTKDRIEPNRFKIDLLQTLPGSNIIPCDSCRRGSVQPNAAKSVLQPTDVSAKLRGSQTRKPNPRFTVGKKMQSSAPSQQVRIGSTRMKFRPLHGILGIFRFRENRSRANTQKSIHRSETDSRLKLNAIVRPPCLN